MIVGSVVAVNDTVLVLIIEVFILVMKIVLVLIHKAVGLTLVLLLLGCLSGKSFGFLSLVLELISLELALLRRALPRSFLLLPFKLLGHVCAL